MVNREPPVETKIEQLRMEFQRAGHWIPTSVRQINGFPCSGFTEFQSDLLSGKVVVVKEPKKFDSIAMAVFSTPAEWMIVQIFSHSLWAVPLIIVIASYFFSFWLLLFVPAFFFWVSRKHVHYVNNIYLNRAMASENAFCVLFYTGHVGVTWNDYYEHLNAYKVWGDH
jgi:hypothetical protein